MVMVAALVYHKIRIPNQGPAAKGVTKVVTRPASAGLTGDPPRRRSEISRKTSRSKDKSRGSATWRPTSWGWGETRHPKQLDIRKFVGEDTNKIERPS